MISIPGEKAAADPLADLGAEASLADSGANLLLTRVRPDGEAPPSLLSQMGAGAAEPGLAMAHPATDARALKTAAKTGLQLGITGQNLRHEAPPSASNPWEGNCLLLFPPVTRGLTIGDQGRDARKQG
jgi:hypothetical protein